MIKRYLPNNNEKCYSNISQNISGTKQDHSFSEYIYTQFFDKK
jgi:hypothetical protein